MAASNSGGRRPSGLPVPARPHGGRILPDGDGAAELVGGESGPDRPGSAPSFFLDGYPIIGYKMGIALGPMRPIPEILFVDFGSPPCASPECRNSPRTIPRSVACAEAHSSADLTRLGCLRPELLVLRVPSARLLIDSVRLTRVVCPGARHYGLLCCDDVSCEDLRACFATGIDDFVCCPFREAVFIARIERLLTRRQPPLESEETGTLRFGSLVAASPGLCKLLALVPTMARSTATVLITGETGTGKEVIARVIHYQSPRKGRPFVPINCGAVPDHLFENELFGHARGAYTDASSSEEGLLAEAEGGTLFLDEIDALSASAQAKVLRLLEDGEYRPLGSAKTRHADIRVVAATSADLRRLVTARGFREDLYHRLNVLTLHIPPLRERMEDIPALARHFLSKYGPQSLYGSITLSPGAQRKLMLHRWPGNVRELEKTIQRVVILAPAPVLEADQLDLPGTTLPDTPERHSFRQAKRQAVDSFELFYVTELMATHGGNVSRAARAAGKERRSFQRLLHKHGLDTASFGCGANARLPAASSPHL